MFTSARPSKSLVCIVNDLSYHLVFPTFETGCNMSVMHYGVHDRHLITRNLGEAAITTITGLDGNNMI